MQGWIFHNTTYTAGNSCGADCNSFNLVSNSKIISAPTASGYIDPNVSMIHPIYSVYGGTVQNASIPFTSNVVNQYGSSFLRLGHLGAQNRVEKVSKVVKIDSLHWYFKFAYMVIVQSGAQGTHPPWCCQYPMFRVNVNSIPTNTITNFFFNRNTFLYNPSVFQNVCIPNTQDTFFLQNTNTPYASHLMTNSFQTSFTKWREVVFDFSSFIGDTIIIDFLTNSCDDGFHNAYAYIDAQCFAGNIYANNVLNTTGTFTACSSATLSTVPGYTYSWNGPNISNVLTQSLIVNTSGTYSLNIYNNQNLICTQTISVTINTLVPIQVSTTCDTICKNTSCFLSVPQNMISYQWNSGSQTFSTLVTPSVTTFYYVHAVDSNGCYTVAYKTLVIKECTGLPDLNTELNFKAYPNPTSDKFFIESNNITVTSVNIVDILGKSIPINISQDKIQVIDLSDFPKGIYILKVRTQNSTATFKIIKN
ncbi:MAG: T9SS type A sorting domain-containing protein [Sphingobacteriaceae bacterium]